MAAADKRIVSCYQKFSGQAEFVWAGFNRFSLPPKKQIMSFYRTPISRRAFLPALLAASLGLVSIASTGRAADSLNVVLIAGVKNDAYDNEPSLKRVQDFLEKTYNVKCAWVRPGADGASLQNLEALEKADTAVLLVRRMTIPANQLAQIKRYCESGKGLVGIRTATHALNEWPTFDVDVFGAKYGNHFGPVQSLSIKQHAVTRQAADFQTTKDMYKYEVKSPDVQVLIEGKNDQGTMPAAWVRESPKGRVFYVGFGLNEEFEKPAFWRLIGSAVIWTAHQRISEYRR